jgi:outer membrane protein OmpA-like peptidoglycan-associated protein
MRHLTSYLILSVFLCTTATLTAQTKRADEAFRHHHYPEAIELYQQAIRRDLDNDKAITNLAIAYWRTNQLLQAEYWFTRAALMNEDPEVKRMFAQVLIANEKYEQAAIWLQKYMAAQTNDEKLHEARQLHAWARGLAAGAEVSNDIRVVPISVNSEDLDFAPVVHKGTLYFTTNRKGVNRRDGEYDPWTGQRFTDVYAAPRQGENEFGSPVPAADLPLTPYHDGPLCFSADGRELFLSTSDVTDRVRRYDAFNNTRVQIKHYLLGPDGAWVAQKALPFINSECTSTHPALSADGKTLVFASDRESGIGGMDVYFVERSSSGEWSAPQPLGAHINTRGNEVFPSFDAEGNLYFSSDMHPGFGGLDVFRAARMGDGRWGVPENLGRPINSPRDDFGMHFDADGNTGFFSSNRNPDKGDDVLFFKRTTGVRIDGLLVDCVSGAVIPNARVELFGGNNYRDVDFTDVDGRFSFIVDEDVRVRLQATHERYMADGGCTAEAVCQTTGLKSGQRMSVQVAMSPLEAPGFTPGYLCGVVAHSTYGNPLAEAELTLRDEAGNEKTILTNARGAFFTEVEAGAAYEVSVNKAAFIPIHEVVTVMPQTDQCHAVTIALEADRMAVPPPLPIDVKVEKDLVIELFHIYFDLASSSIRNEAKQDLDTFYQLLMKYPGMSGEIMAHTDARGEAAANLQLSQRRADAVRQYLIDQGIEADRLVARGYGETQLVNHCADGVDCTDEQHQRNRRVEFRIVDLGDAAESAD